MFQNRTNYSHRVPELNSKAEPEPLIIYFSQENARFLKVALVGSWAGHLVFL